MMFQNILKCKNKKYERHKKSRKICNYRRLNISKCDNICRKHRLSRYMIKETMEIFGVESYKINKWVKRYEETCDLSNKALNREYKKTNRKKLIEYI